MPYYYGSVSQQFTNASANTDTSLQNWKTTAAGQRAYIQKLIAGTYVTPADNAVRLRLQHTTANMTAGGAFTAQPLAADAPAAAVTTTTLPTAGTQATVFLVQLAFNQRGTAMWAAFNPDEAVCIVGTVAGNQEVNLMSQSTGTSIAIPYTVMHSE
jgi:hypothetical protein